MLEILIYSWKQGKIKNRQAYYMMLTGTNPNYMRS